MGPQPLPGVQARYSFVPAGGAVGFRLAIGFDPRGLEREAVRRACQALLRHLTGPQPATVKVSPSVSAESFTATESGGSVAGEVAEFAKAIVATLDGAIPEPSLLELDFRIDPREAAGLPNDMFELAVLLHLGEGAFGPAEPPSSELPFTVTASPLLPDHEGGELEALNAFAATFEAAWDGFDGADGALKLAAIPALEPPALLCVRLSSAEGLEISRAVGAAPAYYAVPPLSTSLLGGTVADPDGGGGGSESYAGVDLDRWWARFVIEFERLSRAALADNRAASSERLQALAAVRAALAQAFAGRAVPLAAETPESAGEEILTVLDEAAAADLTARPTATAMAVTVRRPAAGSSAFTAMLRGKAVTPHAGAGPAALPLKKGERRLAFTLPSPPQGQARHRVAARFEGEWLDRAGTPPLRLLLPARSPGSGRNPLHLDLGEHSVPLPLIAVPHPPRLITEARPASAAAATLGEALIWAVEAEVAEMPAAQDRLELTLGFDSVAGAAAADVAAAGELFDALARALRFAPADPADLPGLDRFLALAAAVAEALPGWQAPVANPAVRPGGRRYDIDFGEAPALNVSRDTDGPGEPPPWPVLGGYVTPASAGAVGRYEPEPGAALLPGLRVTFTGLRAPAVRTAQVSAGIRRNGGLLAPAAVDPAFVYRGALVSAEAVAPRLDWSAPDPLPLAVSLGTALDQLLDPIGEDPAKPYLLDLDFVLVQCLAGGSEGLETRQPILAVRTWIGAEDGATRLTAVKAGLMAQLSEFRGILGASADPAAIEFTVAFRDRQGDPDALARLQGRIPVLADPAWWQEPPKPA